MTPLLPGTREGLVTRSAWREMREAAARRKPSVLLGKVLYLDKLTVSFDRFKALDALTLHVDPGELLCIIGPNGAGKTTMMDVITGKTRPDKGSVWFGQDLNLLALTEPEIAQAGIGRKFQKPTVFEFLNVFENLELALADDKSFWHTLVARLTPVQRERIDEVLHMIGLEAERDRVDHDDGDDDGRTGGRHDTAGDRAYWGAAAVARREALSDRRGARHGLRAVDREAGHGPP